MRCIKMNAIGNLQSQSKHIILGEIQFIIILIHYSIILFISAIYNKINNTKINISKTTSLLVRTPDARFVYKGHIVLPSKQTYKVC